MEWLSIDLSAADLARIQAALGPGESVADFLTEALEQELARRGHPSDDRSDEAGARPAERCSDRGPQDAPGTVVASRGALHSRLSHAGPAQCR